MRILVILALATAVLAVEGLSQPSPQPLGRPRIRARREDPQPPPPAAAPPVDPPPVSPEGTAVEFGRGRPRPTPSCKSWPVPCRGKRDADALYRGPIVTKLGRMLVPDFSAPALRRRRREASPVYKGPVVTKVGQVLVPDFSVTV